MLPNQYLKDHPYNQFSVPYGANPYTQAIHPNFIGMDILEHQKALGRAQANIQANIQASIQANSNIDSLLHVHRRKLQRRAANRKSAQLSRARKKAHLEELRIENARLQQLVDVLDSQPELVFCVNANGDITYISERTINFVNVSGATEDNEEDPTHISQILSKGSVEVVLKTIEEIIKISPPKSALAESSMLFASKEVEFQDAFGHPLVGSLRVARVNRRPSLDELSAEDVETAVALSVPLPPAPKKARTGKNAAANEVAQQEYDRLTAAAAAAAAFQQQASSGGLSALSGANPQISNLGVEEWNLTNFKLLTDCVSNLADHHDKRRRDEPTGPAGGSGSNHGGSSASVSSAGASMTSHSSYAQMQQQQQAQYQQMLNAASGVFPSGQATPGSGSGAATVKTEESEADSEFVCVIRTSDSYYARYSTRSDLFMFVSTPLSTATMEAHDQKPGNAIARHATLGGGSSVHTSSHGGSSSVGSRGAQLTAGKEHQQRKTGVGMSKCSSTGSTESTAVPNSLSGSSGTGSKGKDITSSEGNSDDNSGSN